MELIKYIFKLLWRKIKSIFEVESEYNSNYVHEIDMKNTEPTTPEAINATLSFVDPENPVFINLKKIVTESGINNITDIVNFFTICYENRLKPNWCEETILGLKDNNRKLNTAGKMNFILFNQALEAFFLNMGCKIDQTEEGKNGLEKAVIWTITEMTAKWITFISCDTLSGAVSLIFKERDKREWEVFDLKEKHLAS